MAIYAIGDIHGCSLALETLLKYVPLTTADTLVFLGDYIDRGPDSKNVIEQILSISQEFNTITLRGNHEVMMLEALVSERYCGDWLYFGGEQTLASYNSNGDEEWHNKIPFHHWTFLKQTLPYYETENFIFVHAGLIQGLSLAMQSESDLYWKHPYEPEDYDVNKFVVCGHTPQKNGLIKKWKNTLFVDTFAYGGQWLSCLDCKSGNFWQANQKKETNTGNLELQQII